MGREHHLEKTILSNNWIFITDLQFESTQSGVQTAQPRIKTFQECFAGGARKKLPGNFS